MTREFDIASEEYQIARRILKAANYESIIPKISVEEAKRRGYKKITGNMGASAGAIFLSQTVREIGCRAVIACTVYNWSQESRYQLSVWTKPQ